MRNKLILFVLGVIIISNVSAQKYIPIPLDSTIWKVYYWAQHPWPYTGCGCYMVEYTAGDTLINSKTYTLIKRFKAPNCNQCASAWINRAAIRQDSATRKVYILLPDSINEHVLYDFSQTAGDTCNSILYPDPFACGQLIISSVDSILINNKYHRRLNLQGGCLITGNASLIEGVGSTLGLLEKLVVYESGTNLICAHQYKTINISIYPSGGFICDTSSTYVNENENDLLNISVLPNPFNNKISILSNKELKNITITLYDIYSNMVFLKKISIVDKIDFIDLNLATGIYLYRIYNDNNLYKSGKIIKN